MTDSKTSGTKLMFSDGVQETLPTNKIIVVAGSGGSKRTSTASTQMMVIDTLPQFVFDDLINDVLSNSDLDKNKDWLAFVKAMDQKYSVLSDDSSAETVVVALLYGVVSKQVKRTAEAIDHPTDDSASLAQQLKQLQVGKAETANGTDSSWQPTELDKKHAQDMQTDIDKLFKINRGPLVIREISEKLNPVDNISELVMVSVGQFVFNLTQALTISTLLGIYVKEMVAKREEPSKSIEELEKSNQDIAVLQQVLNDSLSEAQQCATFIKSQLKNNQIDIDRASLKSYLKEN